MPRDAAPPPDDLDDESKDLWRKTKRHLVKQGTWQDSDAATLERYVRAMQRAREARSATRGLTTKGSQGQLVQHPNLKTEREALRDAHLYATDLLLTPASRRRAQIGQDEGEEDALTKVLRGG